VRRSDQLTFYSRTPAYTDRRLFRLDHASRLDQIEEAMAAIGKTVEVEIKEAA
jgi:hypothetical protein